MVCICNFYNWGEKFKDLKHHKAFSYFTESVTLLPKLPTSCPWQLTHLVRSTASAVTRVPYTLMSALPWAADYETLLNALMHSIANPHGDWRIGSIINPLLETQKWELREGQARAKGHTAQNLQAEGSTQVCLTLQLKHLSWPALPPERRNTEEDACQKSPSPALDF